ncbi:MAG TPA: NAD-dependent epimerase/dehydratase family protein [Usitatibacter sp.]|nr:NAD-dependent epimerase/dehydratase family protein [Usitatibacter sp.]
MSSASVPLVVTGASGFVGRAVAAMSGPATRTLSMRREDWWREAISLLQPGVTVLHLAGRVHDFGASEADLMRDNAAKTRDLAQLAREKGARRMVFLSSVKVNGEESAARPFRRGDPPAPEDAYGRSKLAAEIALAEAARAGAMEVAVVRAPLVFGRAALGNLRSLARLADSPWPLPFAAIDNRRSYVHVDDLAALLLLCASHPAAVGRTYFAAASEPTSTAALVSAFRAASHRKPRLFPMPPAVLEALAEVASQGARMRRLTRSLEVDPTDAERELGWRAHRSLQDCARDVVVGPHEGRS